MGTYSKGYGKNFRIVYTVEMEPAIYEIHELVRHQWVRHQWLCKVTSPRKAIMRGDHYDAQASWGLLRGRGSCKRQEAHATLRQTAQTSSINHTAEQKEAVRLLPGHSSNGGGSAHSASAAKRTYGASHALRPPGPS